VKLAILSVLTLALASTALAQPEKFQQWEYGVLTFQRISNAELTVESTLISDEISWVGPENRVVALIYDKSTNKLSKSSSEFTKEAFGISSERFKIFYIESVEFFNELGKLGWNMSGIKQDSVRNAIGYMRTTNYYFKRQISK
jgi:hypothetical protein